MTTSDRPTFEYTTEERAVMLRGMRAVSDNFYAGAVRVGVHAFIEFCGLMNEFIKLCEEAHAKGIDFTMANVHTDQHLPFQPHHIAYVYEKLECIYGEPFGTAAANPKSYMTPEHAVTAPSIPPSLLGGPSLATLTAAYTAYAAAPSIQHAAHCHATAPTPDRPTGGCICGAAERALSSPVDQPAPAPREVCGAENSIPYEYTTIGQKCTNTKPCPDHDDAGNRRRPWNS